MKKWPPAAAIFPGNDRAIYKLRMLRQAPWESPEVQGGLNALKGPPACREDVSGSLPGRGQDSAPANSRS